MTQDRQGTPKMPKLFTLNPPKQRLYELHKDQHDCVAILPVSRSRAGLYEARIIAALGGEGEELCRPARTVCHMTCVLLIISLVVLLSCTIVLHHSVATLMKTPRRLTPQPTYQGCKHHQLQHLNISKQLPDAFFLL